MDTSPDPKPSLIPHYQEIPEYSTQMTALEICANPKCCSIAVHVSIGYLYCTDNYVLNLPLNYFRWILAFNNFINLGIKIQSKLKLCVQFCTAFEHN